MKTLFWGFPVLFLAIRTHHFDEAWQAGQPYWLVEDGQVRSELFRGFNGWENQIFIYRKLFICLSAGGQALFGFSPAAGKSFSMLWTTQGGLALWGYLRQHHLSARFVWLSVLLYIANGILIEYTFVYPYDGKRPAPPLADTRPLTNSPDHIGNYHRVYQDRWSACICPTNIGRRA